MEETTSENLIEEIAIIGFAGRFPGAKNIYEYWKNLIGGVESIRFFEDDELSETVSPDLIANPNYIKARAILDEAEYFDASFFDISHREAEIMDPQQRVFLECSWEALESAGYNPLDSKDVVSVYGGVDLSSYIMNVLSNPEVVDSMGVLQAIMNNDKDHLCTRVSHKFNLTGGSVVVQSACSTSLTAVHMACRGLLNYECDMALAGGSSIKFPQESGHFYQKGGITSPDGHCRAFDQKAKGTVAGSGVGLVVLKRLSDAEEDGDYIHAVIKATAINNDGSNKMSYAAPSVEGQSEVIAMAHELAEINPETITYIEAHGTGTELGDPIEIEALTQAFKRKTDKKNFCGIGSVKTNIGHLDAAAGVASLIKTILALKNKQIPPTLHFEKPNPNIDFANSPFYVIDKLKDWEVEDIPRRAGVSSYGMGGTNVHVILEEYNNGSERAINEKTNLFPLTARTKHSLNENKQHLKTFLTENPETNLGDIAYTLQTGRKSFLQREFIISNDTEDLIRQLEIDNKKAGKVRTVKFNDPKLIMLFPGQGSQFVNMGRELYEKNKVFKDQFDKCAVIIKSHTDIDLTTILYPRENVTENLEEQLKQTRITQPALFAFEYSLAKSLFEFDLEPYAMIGHSIGEYVAACVSGVFSLEDALKLVINRGELMQGLPQGDMIAVSLKEKEVKPYLSDKVSLATINSPNLCVLSGETNEIKKVEKQLNEKDIFCRILKTSHAFHSSMMNPILDDFEKLFEGIEINKPTKRFLSNVTGKWITNEEATSPKYWVDHIRNAVRFSDNVKTLLDKESELIWLEVGAGTTLSGLTKQHFENPRAENVIQLLGSAKEKKTDEWLYLNALGKIWQQGLDINWQALHKDCDSRKLMLPTYQFDKKKYWLSFNQSQTPTNTRQNQNGVMPLDDWFYFPNWKKLKPLSISSTFTEKEKIALIYTSENLVQKDIKSLIDDEEILLIEKKDKFEKNTELKYSINPEKQTDFDSLFEALTKSKTVPDVLVYALPIEENSETKNDRDHFRAKMNDYFYPLLKLAKAIASVNITKHLKIVILTNNLYKVTETESIQPEKATLIGLSRVISQEYPNVICSIIDIDENGISGNFDNSFRRYLVEDHLNREHQMALAFRNNRQWILDYEKIDLAKSNYEVSNFKDGGSYLITGGLGSVGMIIARHLAENYKAKLTLVGRSEFPPRSEWETHIESEDSEDHLIERINNLKQLEALGAKVLTVSANVSDKNELTKAFEEGEKIFGRIDGVLHGAGVSGNLSVKTIPETTSEVCELHFEPKIFGLTTLYEIVEEKEIEFCLLLSSLSAVLGGLGFTAYSAVNNFMDSFVEKYDPISKTKWQSVDWDGWLIGDAGQNSANQFSMKPDEGCEALERIINTKNLSTVVVSKGDLEQRINTWLNFENETKEMSSENEIEKVTYPRPDLSSDYEAPSTPIEDDIERAWSDVLGVENVGVEDNFFELGGHSLLATQLVTRMRTLFDIDLPLRTFFETPTIKELANIIVKHQANNLSSEDIESISQNIKDLSDEDIQALLEKEKKKAA